jgi:hypothetical protein
MLRTFSRSVSAVVCILVVFVSALWAATVESIPAATDTRVPESIRKVLAPRGYRVTLDDGSTRTVWFRAQVPTGNFPENSGAAYPDFAESTFFGVIAFDKPAGDYRGQSIPAGVYGLRYELHPQDGNHLGVAPARDFLLLTPIATDSNPDQTYKFKELVALSMDVTHTKHPAVFNLPPVDAKQFPSVATDFENHTTLSVKITTSKGETPVALVVDGKSEQ